MTTTERRCLFCGEKMRPFDKGTHCSNHRSPEFVRWLQTRHRQGATVAATTPGETGSDPPPAPLALGPDKIIEAVCKQCNVTSHQLASIATSRELGQARMIAMYLIRKHCGLLTSEAIAHLFNREVALVDASDLWVREGIRNKETRVRRPLRLIEQHLQLPSELRSL